MTGNGYMVTYAFGHLVQLTMPEEYGFSGFVRENLPILPEVFNPHCRLTAVNYL
jgi:DNA topoisomerase-3